MFSKIIKLNSINIDKTDYINAINLHLGLYYPLLGFVSREEFKSIITKKKINGLNFTIPINIFCSKKKYEKFKLGDKINLFYKGEVVGYLKLRSKFKVNKNFFLKSIFGTINKKHKGVKNFSQKINKYPFSLGGRVFVFLDKIKKFIENSNFELLKKIKKIKKKDVAFSTRNIPHIGHNLIQETIIKSKKKLTVFLILNTKNKYPKNLLMKTYQSLRKNKKFKDIKIVFIYLPTFFGGPKEAFFQAKIFENLKYKFFYVGRDHAGYKSFYKKFDSQKIFKKLKSKIKIIKLNEPMLCESCNVSVINKYINKKCCPLCEGKKLLELNGSDIKILIKQKKSDQLIKYLDQSVYNVLKKNNFSLQNQ